MFTRAVSSKRDVLARQHVDFLGILTQSTTVLEKLRSGRSLEVEFRVDQHVVTTKTEYTGVLNGGGSGGEGLHRWAAMPRWSAFHASAMDTLE